MLRPGDSNCRDRILFGGGIEKERDQDHIQVGGGHP